MGVISLLGRILGCALFLGVLFPPAWWLAGRLREGENEPFFRLLLAAGLALTGYISGVNLIGRLTGSSIAAVWIYLSLSVAASVLLLLRERAGFSLAPLAASWRAWIGPIAIAMALALPQWLAAVSTNYWDEAASSAIHLTAANQFAEGVFPPRHNAFPDVSIKYHYAFMILSGTVEWLTGLSANMSIDVVSTALWLFVFLFVFFWLRRLAFDRHSSLWGSFAVLLGGGLAWIYLPRVEAYSTAAYEKLPAAADLVGRFDAVRSWLANFAAVAQAPSLHLRNADGSLSNLPWDIAAQFQQHAVALGMALALPALWCFVAWQAKKEFHLPLLLCNIVCFGVLFLGHAVFGGVAAVTAGICLLLAWLGGPTRVKTYNGLAFVAGLGVLAFLHGGMLARGSEYGAGGFMTLRKAFGYAAGGAAGFIHWNIAGFGLPLLLSVLAWAIYWRSRRERASEERILFTVLTVFVLFSYLVPQIAYYVTEGNNLEQYTEISKFFFCTHFGLALLSAFGAAYLVRRLHPSILIPCGLAAAIVPLGFCYDASFDAHHKWLGFYHSPYFPNSVEEQMGKALRAQKSGPRETYFDASNDERKHGYLGELLIFGGSVFTMTPSRFERNGVSYRLAEQVIAPRLKENGRMARLLPGAPEEARCRWFYARPLEDMAHAPVIVRARFDKLVSEGRLVKRQEAGARALYSIDKPTLDLDHDIEVYWRPRIVLQTRGRGRGERTSDLIFYDYANKRILVGEQRIDLPPWLGGEFTPLYVDSFPGDGKADFLLGRLDDTYYHLGKGFNDVTEHDNWEWTYRDSAASGWDAEYARWFWDYDTPLVADLEGQGFSTHLAYRYTTGEWIAAPWRILKGPLMNESELPLPFAGRFLKGSSADLGLWSLRTGMLKLRSLTTGQEASFQWGGHPSEVLVPGDYDGDGVDEIGVWNRTNRTWYWKHAPDGPLAQVTFGTETGVPVPFDYNRDGRLDLAYWEPREGKIYVSYNLGRTVDLAIPVPPHGLPAFVNMY